MKKRFFLIGTVAIILASIVVIASCKKDKNEKPVTSSTSTTVVEPENQNLLVTDLHHSDCLNSGVEKKDTIGSVLTLDRNGDNLYFEWPDCTSLCEVDSFAIFSNIIGDTLEIDVRSYGGANCTCEYSVDATINKVPRKSFLVKVYYGIMVLGRNIRGELFYSKWINLQ